MKYDKKDILIFIYLKKDKNNIEIKLIFKK